MIFFFWFLLDVDAVRTVGKKEIIHSQKKKKKRIMVSNTNRNDEDWESWSPVSISRSPSPSSLPPPPPPAVPVVEEEKIDSEEKKEPAWDTLSNVSDSSEHNHPPVRLTEAELEDLEMLRSNSHFEIVNQTDRFSTSISGLLNEVEGFSNSERVSVLRRIILKVKKFTDALTSSSPDLRDLTLLTMEIMTELKYSVLVPGETKRELVKRIVAAWIQTYVDDERQRLVLLTWVLTSNTLINSLVETFPKWFKPGKWKKWFAELKCCS